MRPNLATIFGRYLGFFLVEYPLNQSSESVIICTMSDDGQPTIDFPNADLSFIHGGDLFEEEQQAWETLLAVSFEIKQSLNEIDRKLAVFEESFSRR